MTRQHLSSSRVALMCLVLYLVGASAVVAVLANGSKIASWSHGKATARVRYVPTNGNGERRDERAPLYANLKKVTLTTRSRSVLIDLRMAAPMPTDHAGTMWVEVYLHDAFPSKKQGEDRKIVGVIAGSYGSKPPLLAGHTAVVAGRQGRDATSYTANRLQAGRLRVVGTDVTLEFPASVIPPSRLRPLVSLKGRGSWAQLKRYLLEARVYCLPSDVPASKVKWLYFTDDLCIPPYSQIEESGPEHPPIPPNSR